MRNGAHLEKQSNARLGELPPEPQHSPDPRDLGRSMTGLVNAVARGMDKRLADYNISSLEFTILSVCLSSETTTLRELGKVIPIDRGRISRMVNALYDRGFLVRRRDRKDRRVVHLRLSQMGQRIAPELVQRVREHNIMLLEGVTEEEMRQFVTVSRKIEANYRRKMGKVASEENLTSEDEVDSPE